MIALRTAALRLVAIARLAAVVAAVGLGASGAHAAGEEARPTDPRVIQADALLGDETQRARAIALYREALQDRPGDDYARMWLARVLSWDGRFDEAVAEYDVFLGRPAPPEWAAVERAEVLSWAGRNDEAEQAFRAILADDPGNARAVRGLARVYQWSGRPQLAERAWEQALAMEDDDAAREALAALRASRVREAELDGDWFRDSDHFTLTTVHAKAGVDLDLATRILGEASATWVSADRDDSDYDPLSGQSNHTRGLEALLGVQHRLGGGLTARALVGGRQWSHGGEAVLARAALDWTISDRWVAGLEAEYGDFLDRTHSLDAVLEGVRATTLRATTWADLPGPWAVWAYTEGSFVTGDERSRSVLETGPDANGIPVTREVARLADSGDNARAAGGFSVDLTPWEDRDWRLSVGLDMLHYRDDSAIFYDPHFSADGMVGLSGSQPLTRWLALAAEVAGGYGYAKQDGEAGDGPTWRVAGGPDLRLGPFWLRARVVRSVSQRAQEYRSWGASLALGGGF